MRTRHFVFVGCGLAACGAALLFIPGRTVSVEPASVAKQSGVIDRATPPKEEKLASVSMSGLPCLEDEPIRPFAVMLAADPLARPLSGIGAADLVIEMPVITSGINRLLAVFSCPGDFEIGSVRSARDDFIPLAASLDAIYGHWGGSHFALARLRKGVIENIDALRNPYGAYFRKRGIAAPHNGFTTLARLQKAAQKLGYRVTPQREGGVFPRDESTGEIPVAQTVTIRYPGIHRVEWAFDLQRGSYRRKRGGTPEIDKNTGRAVEAKTIVVMRTTSRQIEGQYNDVRVTGSGDAIVYREGRELHARWEKAAEPLAAPLRFLDQETKEIPFAKGPAWIEIVQQDTVVRSE